MIVQAISNAYASTSDNAFSLYVPGAGWRDVDNVCASQFGGSFAWGQQTGGVRDRAECANLPSDLQAGCYWRFDWFMNADYSELLFREVPCPSVLTGITGCIRN